MPSIAKAMMKDLSNMPEWVIYKNEQKIGQAKSWGRALEMIVKQEDIKTFYLSHLGLCQVNVYQRIPYTYDVGKDLYKIIKER